MSDLIKREDAINAVTAYLDLCCMTEARFHKDGKSYNRQIAEELLEDVLTVEPKHGEWIPCSERLPERQGYYICTCKDGSKYKKATVVKWSNGWQLTGSRAYWVILAWMPLPEPWKGADDD